MVPVLHAFGHCGCRFVPSCSHYAEHLFQKEWSFKHFFMSLKRILRCNAWATPILTFDPPTADYIYRETQTAGSPIRLSRVIL
jgi:putative component of membrane protein insertase Oxa1/YidC/SpoIIIJ protein YidD